MSRNNDGKYLEDSVSKWYDNQNEAGIALIRLPDTRSARGIIKAKNADFLMSVVTHGALHLECKSIGGKKFKLRNFRQYPTMLRWALAGTPGYVMAHFWELQRLMLFNIDQLGPLKGGGWDVSNVAGWGEKDDETGVARIMDRFVRGIRK